MKTELVYLLLTAILTGVIVIGCVSSGRHLTPFTYKVAPTTPLPDWVNRANRANVNAVKKPACTKVGSKASTHLDCIGALESSFVTSRALPLSWPS